MSEIVYVQNKTNVFGIVGLVVSIVGLLTFCCYGIGGFVSVLALILSIVGLTIKNANKGCAVAGLTISIITLVLTILMFIGLAGVGTFGYNFSNILT